MLWWLVRFGWRRARGQSAAAVTTLTIRGLRFTLDWGAAEHVAIREIVARGEYWRATEFRPAPGDVVVDVGSNAGVFSVVAAAWIGDAGRLVAIEPNPLVLERLRKNLRDNGFEGRSVVIPVALSDRAGAARLIVDANSAIGAVEVSDRHDSGVAVELATLDRLAGQLHLPAVDLLKMDVEGLELAALDGARAVLRTCRRLVLEVSRPGDVNGVLERCEAAGFDEVVVRPAGPDSGATIVFARRTLKIETQPA